MCAVSLTLRSPNGTSAAVVARRRDLGAPILSTDLGLLFDSDCMDLFSAIKDEAVDCVFADPPFNLRKDYGNGAASDDLDKARYLDWSYAWIDECVRVVKPGGAVFIYILPQWGYHFAKHLDQAGMTFRHWIALSMKGTFPRGRKLYPAHYAILYFTKGAPTTFNRVRLPVPQCRHCKKDIKDYGGHSKYLNPLGLNLTDFWEDTAPARHSKFKARWHINELKPQIPSRCFQIATNPDDVVLDPFGGGGSTYEAAQGLGRLWIGSEIATVAAIVARLKDRYPLVCGKEPPRKLRTVFRQGINADHQGRNTIRWSQGTNRTTRPTGTRG
jgi:site-specific DNA-methyltransferase (adenine-specific)